MYLSTSDSWFKKAWSMRNINAVFDYKIKHVQRLALFF